MKRFIISIQVLSFWLTIIILLSTARATGLGFYFSSGSGSSGWSLEKDGYTFPDFEKDTEHKGFGFILDTAVARNGVF